jgi:hypothetical protein
MNDLIVTVALYGEREKMVGVYLVKSLFYMEVQYSVRF